MLEQQTLDRTTGRCETDLDRVRSEPLSDSVKELLPLYYARLKEIAHRERGRIQPFSTLNTTSVVHEAYVRLAGNSSFKSREHFLRTSVVAMRYVIIDRVRAQLAAKRGGLTEHVSIDQCEAAGFIVENDAETLSVHDALNSLQKESPRLAAVAECRYFGGFDDADTAEALGVSIRTVRRDWVMAKAWLARELDSLASSVQGDKVFSTPP